LNKLIAGEVRQTRTNVTQSKLFSKRLEASITRYHVNAPRIRAAPDVLGKLDQLAQHLRRRESRPD
jgi:hypothetical protein